MKILALSGWGQPHDALSHAFPSATHVDYARADGFESALKLLEPYQDYDVVVGWSMGGQLAVRAVAENVLSPRMVMLLATPYQFVKTAKNPIGMRADTAALFRENFLRDAPRTLKKSYALISHEDSREEHIKPYLADAMRRLPGYDWLHWYDELTTHTPGGYIQKTFPRTLIVHGARDVVVPSGHSDEWKKHIPHAHVHVWDSCSHAPHWHDGPRLRTVLEQAYHDV